MPMFHFNLTSQKHDPDLKGIELANEAMARLEAAKFAGAYLRDAPELITMGEDFGVEVADENGRRLFAVKIVLITG